MNLLGLYAAQNGEKEAMTGPCINDRVLVFFFTLPFSFFVLVRARVSVCGIESDGW